MQNNDLDVECSVMVCSYRPDWEKLRMTLDSIIMQQDCRYKLVITDDGSEEKLFAEAEGYLKQCGFTKFIFVANEYNQGTVKNVIQGLRVCEGEYVKPISPGDFLHGRHALRDWIDFMNNHKDCVMSFGDAIYYHFENGKIVATAEYAHPQNIDVCGDNEMLKRYLIYNDICLGAAIFVRINVLMRYLKLLDGKVIYAEDNAYRIMSYCGEKFIFYPQCPILYEHGTGISTNGKFVWKERLRKDWIMADNIMLSCTPCKAAQQLHISKFIHLTKSNCWINRLRKLWLYPSLLLFKLKTLLSPRCTSIVMNNEFVQQLIN